MSTFDEQWDAVKESLKDGLTDKKKLALDAVLDNSREHFMKAKRKHNWLWMMNEVKRRMKYLAGVKSGISEINKVVLPIIRRVMPNIIAQDIIGVQPMATPSGAIFAVGLGRNSQNIHARFSHEMTRIMNRIWKRLDQIVFFRKYRRIRRQMDEARKLHDNMRAQLDNSMRVPAKYLGAGK